MWEPRDLLKGLTVNRLHPDPNYRNHNPKQLLTDSTTNTIIITAVSLCLLSLFVVFIFVEHNDSPPTEIPQPQPKRKSKNKSTSQTTNSSTTQPTIRKNIIWLLVSICISLISMAEMAACVFGYLTSVQFKDIEIFNLFTGMMVFNRMGNNSGKAGFIIGYICWVLASFCILYIQFQTESYMNLQLLGMKLIMLTNLCLIPLYVADPDSDTTSSNAPLKIKKEEQLEREKQKQNGKNIEKEKEREKNIEKEREKEREKNIEKEKEINIEKDKETLPVKIKVFEKIRKSWTTQFYIIFQLIRPYLLPLTGELSFQTYSIFLVIAYGRIVNLQLPKYYRDLLGYLEAYLTGASKVSDHGLAANLMWTVAIYLFLDFNRKAKLVRTLRIYFSTTLSQNATLKLSSQLFTQVHNLPYSYHASKPTGKLVNTLHQSIPSIVRVFTYLLMEASPTILDCIITLITLTHNFDITYSLILGVSAFIYSAITYWIGVETNELRRLEIEADGKVQSTVLDSLANFEVIKIFSSQNHEVDKYKDKLQNELSYTKKIQNRSNLSYFLLGFIKSFTTIALGLLCCYDISIGKRKFQDLAFIKAHLDRFFDPLDTFAFLYSYVQKVVINGEGMLELFGMETELLENGTNLDEKKVVKGGEKDNQVAIQFDNVSFGHTNQPLLLENFNLKVLEGQKVAIIGSTGCGKSTTLKLLLKFFNPQKGTIKLRGKNIKELNSDKLREQLAVVNQNSTLFDTTLKYNLMYSKLDTSAKELEHVVDRVKLKDLISKLDKGYDTEVGGNGAKLSGGEKQRINLARMLLLLKQRDIILLDEPTSAIDNQTAKLLLKEVMEEGKTVLLVTHQLHLLKQMDLIVRVKNGKVVEKGTFEELKGSFK